MTSGMHRLSKNFVSLTCQNNDHIGKDVFLCPVYKLYDDQIGNSPTAIDGDIPNTFKGIKIGVKHG